MTSFLTYFGYMCVILGVLYGVALVIPSLGMKLYRDHFPGAMTNPQRKVIAYLRAVTLMAMFLLIGAAWIVYGSSTTTSLAIATGLLGLVCGIMSAYFRYQLREK